MFDRFSDFKPWGPERPPTEPRRKPAYGPENPYTQPFDRSMVQPTPAPPLPAQPTPANPAAAPGERSVMASQARERVDPRVAQVRAARERLEQASRNTRAATEQMRQISQGGPVTPQMTGPNPYSAPYRDVNRANQAQITMMQDRREAAQRAIGNPDPRDYGARGVYSPLDGRAEAFRRITPAPQEPMGPRPTISLQERAVRDEQNFQAAKAANPAYNVGKNAMDQRNLAANYGVYMRGFMQNPQGQPLTMAEFAEKFRSSSADVMAPIDSARQAAAGRRADRAAAKAEGLRNRQAAAAFQAYGAIPAGVEGERFLTGYAARMNPFATPQMSMNMSDNASRERIAEGTNATQLGVAGINADASMYNSDNQARTGMYTADANAFSSAYAADSSASVEQARIAAAQQRANDDMAFRQKQWEAGNPDRELATRKSQMEYDSQLAEQKRMQDPQTAAEATYMNEVDSLRKQYPDAGEDQIHAMATERAKIIYNQKVREMTLGSQAGNPMAAPQAAPPEFVPPKLATGSMTKSVEEGASRGVITAEGLAKYVADWSASNGGKKPTPEQIAESLRKDGYIVNNETMLGLRRNADAYNEGGFMHGVRDWTQGWVRDAGERDPLAPNAYGILVPEGANRGYSLFPMYRDYQDAGREEEFLKKYGFK